MGGAWTPASSSSSESLFTSGLLLLSDTGSSGSSVRRARRYSRRPSSESEPTEKSPGFFSVPDILFYNESISEGGETVSPTQTVLSCRENKVEQPRCLTLCCRGGAHRLLQGAEEGLEGEWETEVGQCRNKEVKDLLGKRCRDELLGKGCKYKLPARGEERGEKCWHEDTNNTQFIQVHKDSKWGGRVLHHEPTLSVLLALQYNVSKQRCFVWLSHTHVVSGLRWLAVGAAVYTGPSTPTSLFFKEEKKSWCCLS